MSCVRHGDGLAVNKHADLGVAGDVVGAAEPCWPKALQRRRLRRADDVLAAPGAVQTGSISTGFQSLNLLRVLFEELAPVYCSREPMFDVVQARSMAAAPLAWWLWLQARRRSASRPTMPG